MGLGVEAAVMLVVAAVVGTETGAGAGVGIEIEIEIAAAAAVAAVDSDPYRCEDTLLAQGSPTRDWSCSHQSSRDRELHVGAICRHVGHIRVRGSL